MIIVLTKVYLQVIVQELPYSVSIFNKSVLNVFFELE